MFANTEFCHQHYNKKIGAPLEVFGFTVCDEVYLLVFGAER